MVQSWGAASDILHEPPPSWTVKDPPDLHPNAGDHGGADAQPATVLFVGTFAGDEPVEEVVEAARLLDGVEVLITGDLDRRPPSLPAGAPQNVVFTGFLRGEDYRRTIESAHVVVALTTEPTSVMRAAYEAVWAGRPVVLSETRVLRRLFPGATFALNDRESLRAAITEVLNNYEAACSGLTEARQIQGKRWDSQAEMLRSHLDP